MPSKIQQRGGTAAQWTAANPILAVREVGWEIDTGNAKIGDGVTAWVALFYAGSAAVAAAVASEATARTAADNLRALLTDVTAEATARAAAIDAETAARVAADTAETAARAAADAALTDALAAKETPAGAQAKADDASSGKLDTAGSLELLSVYAYGHSYLSLGGTVGAAWPARLGRRTGAIVSNRGVGGEQLAQTVLTRMFNGAGVIGVTPGLTGIYIIDCMINDMRQYGTHAGSINTYKDLLRCAICLCRATALKHETDASIAYTGAWASLAHSLFIGTAAKYSGTTGDYADITFTGDEITVFGMRSNGVAAGGKIDLLVPPSGPVLASLDQEGTATTSLSTGAVIPFSPIPARLTGFGPGTHTVRALVSRGAGLAYLDGYVIPMAAPPTVVIVKDQLLPTWTGGSNAAPYNAGSDASIAAYKAAIDAVVAEFPAGQVLAVDPVTAWDKATCLNVDGVHPNDRGHSVYAAAITTALTALPYRAGQNTL